MYNKNIIYKFSLPVVLVGVFGCSAENDQGAVQYDEYSQPNELYTTGPASGTGGTSAAGTNQTSSFITAGQGGGTSAAGTNQTSSFITAGQGSGWSQDEWAVVDRSNNLGDSCASFSAAAKRVEKQVEKEVPIEVRVPQPVSIYIMLDQSGSMWIPDITLAFKWMVASDAISTFVNDPNSAGINAALGYFPILGAPCDGSQYDVPAVPMGRLPDNAAAISGSLALMFSFGGTTPTEPALIGATNYCAQFKQDPVANPDGEDCVVIFITDGMPEECNTDSAYIASIAGDAYNNHGVTTFAIGMSGADFNMLNQLAEAGQGDHDCHPDDPLLYACNVSLPDMNLLQALELIRSYIVKEEIEIVYETVYETEVLDCEWEIPEPPPNEVFDRDKVNVEFSATGQVTDGITIPRADNAAACKDNIAWYYDASGTHIVACPQACSMIQAAELGTIDIVLGCEVVIIE